MPKMTVERQRELEQQLQLMQQLPPVAHKAGLSPVEIATKIATLARIVAELLAAFGSSEQAKASDGTSTR